MEVLVDWCCYWHGFEIRTGPNSPTRLIVSRSPNRFF